jgi:hypothetical protein
MREAAASETFAALATSFNRGTVELAILSKSSLDVRRFAGQSVVAGGNSLAMPNRGQFSSAEVN